MYTCNLCFTTTIIGKKPYEIEILVNAVYLYSSYGIPIIGIHTHEMERIRKYIYIESQVYIRYTNTSI